MKKKYSDAKSFVARFASQIPSMGPVTVSKLNPDGSKTKLGVANTPEEVKKFLPKLPPVSRKQYAHCIGAMTSEMYRWKGALLELNSRDLPQEDDLVEEAQVMIEDLKTGIETLTALQEKRAVITLKESR